MRAFLIDIPLPTTKMIQKIEDERLKREFKRCSPTRVVDYVAVPAIPYSAPSSRATESEKKRLKSFVTQTRTEPISFYSKGTVASQIWPRASAQQSAPGG
jgi:hypothetical protein